MTAIRGAVIGLALVLAGCGGTRWPVEAPMTSPFGLRWRSVLPEIHRGVDLYVPTGTPVHAMRSGSVRFAGRMSGFGTVVWIDHDDELLSLYAHLSTITVRPGESVEAGTVIGLSGQSGDATGPHLHFEVWRWGRPVDPVPLLGGQPEGRPPLSPRP